MSTDRRILISTVQYEAEIRSRAVSLPDLVATAKELGTAGVEFRDVYWTDQATEISRVRAALDETGLIATYATFATLFDAVANRDKLCAAIDDAARLRSPLVRVFPGQVPASDAAAAWSAAADVVEYAASQGVIIALENFAQSPGNRLAEVKTVLDEIQSPWLQTNLDIGNYAVNGEDVILAIRTLGDQIVSTHLKDVADGPAGRTSTFLGGGKLPIAAIMAEFDRLPRQIIHCFEFAGGGDPAGRIRRSLAALGIS